MEGLTQNEKIIWSVWEEKSPRDVVREAAAKGTHINLAVKYLMAKNGWNEQTARDWFMAEVCKFYKDFSVSKFLLSIILLTGVFYFKDLNL